MCNALEKEKNKSDTIDTSNTWTKIEQKPYWDTSNIWKKNKCDTAILPISEKIEQMSDCDTSNTWKNGIKATLHNFKYMENGIKAILLYFQYFQPWNIYIYIYIYITKEILQYFIYLEL
jgi:hypothetical protein